MRKNADAASTALVSIRFITVRAYVYRWETASQLQLWSAIKQRRFSFDSVVVGQLVEATLPVLAKPEFAFTYPHG